MAKETEIQRLVRQVSMAGKSDLKADLLDLMVELGVIHNTPMDKVDFWRRLEEARY